MTETMSTRARQDPAQRIAARFQLADRLAIWLLVPIIVVPVFPVGGLRGLALGIVFAIGAFFIYAGLRTLVAVVWLRRYFRAALDGDQELVAIWRDAVRTEDYDRAIVHLEELVARKGDSCNALVMLAASLYECDELSRAEDVIERAKRIAHDDDRFRIELLDAARLRKLGQLDDAHDKLSQLVLDLPSVPLIQIEHSRVLAALGRIEEAHAQLKQTRPVVNSFTMRMMDKDLAHSLRKELQKAEADVQRCAALQQDSPA